MARGTVALLLGLFAASVLVILAVTLIVLIVGDVAAGDVRDPLELLWRNLLRTLDPGTMGGDTGSPQFLLAALAVTFGGLFVISALIGVINSGLEGKLAELRKGRSRVIEEGHVVILGWTQQIFSIVAELVEANANQRRTTIVVLADKDKVEMEDELRLRVPETGRTRVVCRSGSPIDLDEIDIANVQTSRAIVVLSPDSEDPDADVIKTLLAITNDPNRRAAPYHVVAELHDPRNLEIARMIGGTEVELVLVGDLIARITAQTCRQSGLSLVYTELLDFGGDEIYFTSQPTLTGRTFGESLTAFSDTSVIGLRRRDGAPELNPPMDTRLEEGDQLVVIAADDDRINLAGIFEAPVQEDLIQPHQPVTPQPERTLILGWNWRAPAIIAELDRYVPPGSELMVLAHLPEVSGQIDEARATMRNLELRFQLGDTTARRTLDGLEVASYDHVIILCYSEVLDVQRADARTLVSLLHLRDIAAHSTHRFSIVSEMLDLRNRSLAEVTRADDFIVSDRLVSLMLSQIAENKHLSAVFEDIFDSEGSEIYLKPASDYVRLGEPLTMYTMIEACRRRNEVAIGYRLMAQANDQARDYGVVINPAKASSVTLAEGDRLILLAAD
ncbi:MAG: potassium transporter TrkA [Chloroflexi bacterium]|nr:potassium transporter TrkA [Chloroflexota bacterium]